MKKFYVFAAVAIAALASCTKSEVVYNQGQQEIGFRQFTGAMTKSEEALSGYATTMGVIAYHNGSTPYINNGCFKEINISGIWGGDPKYYWPLQGTLDFIVYAPHQANGVAYDLADNKKLTVGIDNSGEQQIDYLYGKAWYDGLSKTDSPVSVVLKHALSKVTINVGASANDIFTVSSVLLKDTYQTGSYEVTYTTANDHESKVTPSGSTVNMEFVAPSTWTPTTTVTACTASKLVVPSNQTSIVITYKMAGSDAVLTASIALSTESSVHKWETGKHYIYNITLNANEIRFEPKVEDWAPVSESDHTIG